MLSQLGELKGLDFLKDFGISEQEIEIYKNNRLKELEQHFEVFLFIEPLLHIFLSSNRLTENHINELLEKNRYYKKIGKEKLTSNLNWLLNCNLNYCFSVYQYSFGLAWASNLHQDGISDKDFCKLIEAVNTIEIQEFEAMLPDKKPIELATATQNEFYLQKIRK